jgi:hypothetical protein
LRLFEGAGEQGGEHLRRGRQKRERQEEYAPRS